MYEYCYDQDELAWKEWMKTIPAYKVNPEQAFADIIVPTAWQLTLFSSLFSPLFSSQSSSQSTFQLST